MKPRFAESPAGQTLCSLLMWAWVGLLGAALAVLGALLFIPFNPWVDPRRRAMEWVSKLWGKGVVGMIPGARISVEGLEWLQQAREPFVICPNHESILDILVVLATLTPFKVIAKRRLFRIPPIALHVRLAGYIPAGGGEENGAERVLGEAISWMRQGHHVLVFPEGTRSHSGQLLRFQQGAFYLAQKAGVRVLPVAISGTRLAAPRGTWRFNFFRRHEFRVRILEPFVPEGDPKLVASRARTRICAALAAGGAPAP